MLTPLQDTLTIYEALICDVTSMDQCGLDHLSARYLPWSVQQFINEHGGNEALKHNDNDFILFLFIISFLFITIYYLFIDNMIIIR